MCPVAGEKVIYALLGKKACFYTDITTFPDEILWKHNDNKVVEFNGNIQEEFGSFKGRISMDWHSADLNISEARFEDSGLYVLETYTKNVLQRARYNLEVIGKCSDLHFSPSASTGCKQRGQGRDRLWVFGNSLADNPFLQLLLLQPRINN